MGNNGTKHIEKSTHVSEMPPAYVATQCDSAERAKYAGLARRYQSVEDWQSASQVWATLALIDSSHSADHYEQAAQCCLYGKQLPEYRQYLERAVAAAEETHLIMKAAIISGQLANDNDLDNESRLKWYKRAIIGYRSGGSIHDVFLMSIKAADLMVTMGDLVTAAQYYDDALYLQAHSRYSIEIPVIAKLYMVHMILGDLRAARKAISDYAIDGYYYSLSELQKLENGELPSFVYADPINKALVNMFKGKHALESPTGKGNI